MKSFLKNSHILPIFFVTSIATMILFSGCVFRKTAFQRANLLLRLKIDSIFDLNNAQQEFVRKEIDSLLNDLSKKEIPVLQNILRDASKQLRNKVSEKDIQSYFQRWDEIYKSAFIRMSTPVGQFLSTLQPEQITHLTRVQEDKLQEKNKELLAGISDFGKTKQRKIASQISTWIGALNENQSRAVEVFSRSEFEWSQREIVARQSSQQRLLKALRENHGAQKISEIFIGQQTPPYTQLDPEHVSLRQERRERWIKLITDLAQNMTSSQQQFFEKETQALAIDLALIGAEIN